MSKKKSIEDINKENEENIEELVKQLKMAGVKDKTIKIMLKEIAEHQEKVFIETMEKTFIRMKKTILNNIISEDLLDKGE